MTNKITYQYFSASCQFKQNRQTICTSEVMVIGEGDGLTLTWSKLASTWLYIEQLIVHNPHL